MDIQGFRQAAIQQGYSEEEINSVIAQQTGGGFTPQIETPKPQKAFKPTDLLPIAGGVIGGIGGSFLAPGVGTVVGGGAGSAAGEALRQMLEGEQVDPLKIGSEGVLGTIGGGAGKAVGFAGKAIGKQLTNDIPERLMNSVYREPMKESKHAMRQGQSLGSEALERGQMGTTQQLFDTATKQIDTIENQLQSKLMGTSGKVTTGQLREIVAPKIQEFRQAGNEQAARAIENRIMAIEAENGAAMPAALANQIKRALYDEADKAYGTEAAAGMEGIKTIARAFKESIEKAAPDVKQLNKDLSFYGRQRESMIDKMTRDERNSLFGLTDTIIGTGGLVAGGGAGVIPLVGKKLSETAIARTAAAQGLKKSGAIGNLPGAGLAGDVASQTAGQSAARSSADFASGQQANDKGDYSQNNPAYNIHNSDIIAPESDAVKLALNDPMNNPLGGEKEAPKSTLSGFTVEQLGQAYSKALMAGDAKAAAQLKAMYQFEVEHQKNSEGDGATLELSDGAIKTITDLQGAVKDVRRLTESVGGTNTIGPVSGLRAINPMDADARSMQAEIDRVRQVVGKALEGGVLRKEDEEKYKKILPTMTDTKEVALRKLQQLERKLQEDLETYSSTQQKYGKGRVPENDFQAAEAALQL